MKQTEIDFAKKVTDEAIQRGVASKGVVPSPPTDKAWGGVIRKAAFSGIVFRAGYREVKNVRAHRTPASVWKSTIVKHR
jgi:hypothetical protein